jgi:hypothetical protein
MRTVSGITAGAVDQAYAGDTDRNETPMQMQDQNNSTLKTQPRKLVLKRETLRQLTTSELKLVGGGQGRPGTYNCGSG